MRTMILAAAAALSLTAQAQAAEGWQPVVSLDNADKVCALASLDQTHQTDALLETTLYAEGKLEVQLRLTNMAGPGAALPPGKVWLDVDGRDVYTGYVAQLHGGSEEGMIVADLSPQEFGDVLKALSVSQTMAITMGDGSMAKFPTGPSAFGAYVAVTKCLGQMARLMH